MKKTSCVRFVHGDEITGMYCNTRCHRCDKKIKRTSTDDMKLSKHSMKVIGSMSIERNGEIELTWAHLCRECIDEYVKWFTDFMGEKAMTAREQFAAMTAEDIILLVAADTLIWRMPDTRPSICGYEDKWSRNGAWDYTNWRECLSSALRGLRRVHGHHFQAAAMRRNLVTKP